MSGVYLEYLFDFLIENHVIDSKYKILNNSNNKKYLYNTIFEGLCHNDDFQKISNYIFNYIKKRASIILKKENISSIFSKTPESNLVVAKKQSRIKKPSLLIKHLVNKYNKSSSQDILTFIEEIKFMYCLFYKRVFSYNETVKGTNKKNDLREELFFNDFVKRLFELFDGDLFAIRASDYDNIANGVDFIVFCIDRENNIITPLLAIDAKNGQGFKKNTRKETYIIDAFELKYDEKNKKIDDFKKLSHKTLLMVTRFSFRSFLENLYKYHTDGLLVFPNKIVENKILCITKKLLDSYKP